jgi:hypothetical protein
MREFWENGLEDTMLTPKQCDWLELPPWAAASWRMMFTGSVKASESADLNVEDSLYLFNAA